MRVEAKNRRRATPSSFRISFIIAAIVTSIVLLFLTVRAEENFAVAAEDYVMIPLLVISWSIPLYSFLVKRIGRQSESEAVTGRSQIKGNTLRVYLYIVKRGPCEFRDIQHDLGLSTSSLASYHLGKLMEDKYITQDEQGRYSSTRDRSTELLEGYLRVGKSLFPQLFFLAILFSILVAYFSITIATDPGDVYYLIAIATSTVVALWIEALRFWQRLRF